MDLATVNASENPRRDERLFRDHLAGASFRDLGRRYGLSHTRVEQVVNREGRRIIDATHLQLILSHAKGVSRPMILLPQTGGDDFGYAVSFARWLVEGLERLDMYVRIEYRDAHTGIALLLEDRNLPQTSKEQ